MTKSEFDDIIRQLLQSGIQITLRWDNDRIIHDLNTGMKSHLYIAWDESVEAIRCWGRYDHEATVDSFNGLLWEVKNCMHGRDFADAAWIDLLVNNGILTRHVTTTVTYS